MNLNEENKPTYGTVPADSGATKGSRRNLVVGLVRPTLGQCERQHGLLQGL